MSERFSIVFKKMEDAGAEQQEMVGERAAIRIIYPSHLNASADEMDEIAELRRIVHEIAEGENNSYTTT